MKLIMLILSLALVVVMPVGHADDYDGPTAWKMSRLFNPSKADLSSESAGRIVIFDGLSDVVVNRALDEQFDRIESMMFTRTVITDESGEPMRDPETAELIVEEDGCD